MHADPVIEALCHRLVAEHAAHTVLLYGSRARGTHTPDSDYDVAAFAPRPALLRITDRVGPAHLDVFVYPEATLASVTDELLRLRGARVLLQRDDGGADHFLARLDAHHAAGPPALSADEQRARIDWLAKMAQRMRRGDAEGHFRRVWLLTALLEDYFVLRRRWYEGPKQALAWLARHDEPAHALFTQALQPGADDEAIDRLVARVVDLG